MDEVFWSNVVKRWSDASESVITLKKELAQVKEERALYRSLVYNLRRNDVRDPRQPEHISEEHIHPVQHSLTEEDIDATIRDELQDAEAGLYRAKEEYKRLQKELATSLDQVRALTAENERLTITHRQEMEKLREDMQDSLSRKSQVVPSGSDHLSRKAVVALERQVETLASSVEEYRTDNQRLQDELSATQSKLHKAEENAKVLLASIVKLQEIARHSGILRPLSNLSQYSESRRSSRKLSTSSINEPQNRETRGINPPVETARSLQVNQVPSHTQLEDETVIVEEHAPDSLYQLPPERQRTVDKFPPSTVPTVDPTKNRFNRDFLKVALGDEVQSLMKYLPNDRIDKKAITSSYLCPTLNHHPWCPTHPGQHGFIFVGLGKEKDSYKTPATRNLFVGLPKDHNKGRMFRYLGKYKVHRVNSLSTQEWNTLPDDIKLMYSKLTKDKTQDSRSPETIKLAYDAGEMAVPCVQLQFLSFDELIYSALLSYRNSIQHNKLN